MALTALDPMSALIVVDLQKGITSRPIEGTTGELLELLDNDGA